MPDFTLTIVSYAIGFAVIAGIVALVRRSMKKKNPEALKMTLEQLGIEWAIIQLAYGS
jgi:energy-converting hydrogenase Eha subunit G